MASNSLRQESLSLSVQSSIPSNVEQDENIKPRKRLRKEKIRKSFVQHQKVQKGLVHFSRSGKRIAGKEFQPQPYCTCKIKCHTKIDENQQHVIFTTYYDFPDWTRKTLFLRSFVNRKEVTSKLSVLNPIIVQKERNYTYNFWLLDSAGNKQNVCSHFFYKCLQVNSTRVYRALKTMISNPTSKDHRGNKPSKNKTSQRDEQYVKEFIEKFPKYESHYGRKNSGKYYLASYLNIRKMYIEYKAVSDFRQRTVLSEHVFRNIFNTKFNLSFKRLRTDTCKTCDEIHIKINSNDLNFEQLQEQKTIKFNHHQSVQTKKSEFESDVQSAKNSNGKIQCYTFDLQKTLETPSLTTNVAYYRRQLWTMNLCVYDEVYEKGYMYMWSENIASRGANEIGSCLIKHMQNFLPRCTEEIILYSDSCGGQNRNIKITLLLKKLLTFLENVNKISQKYFISGHSYNSCDRCFGIIEKQRKLTQDIFVPAHWENIVRQAKKKDPKFEVVRMTENDFYSSQKLLDLIVNRKVSNSNTKINWHYIQWIQNIKDKPFALYIKQFHSEEMLQVNLHKKDVLQNMFIDVELQNTPAAKIAKEKYDDLILLLKYIPTKYHDFYKKLQHNGAPVGDYSLANHSDEE